MSQLEILGSRGGCPQTDNPCAGYLFTAGETRILLDCGPGVAGRVWPLLRSGSLTAIVVSHMHGDHFMDLIPLTYGFLGEDDGSRAMSRRPTIWLPPGGRAVLADIARAFGFDDIHVSGKPGGDYAIPLVERYFNVCEYDPTDSFTIGRLGITPRYVPHTIDACALRLQDADRALVYSGDTSGGSALVELARGCDLLLGEASAVRRNASLPPGHLSAREAGEVGARAEVGHLVLTHIIEFDATEQALRQEASMTFNGRVDVALPGRCFTLAQEDTLV